jgi:hypothetical protein
LSGAVRSGAGSGGTMASRLDSAGPSDPCSAGETDDQPHEADTEDRADKGEAARVVGVGLGEDVAGCQVEEHAREEPEVEPEEVVRDGEQERAGGTDDGARASAMSRVSARRRSFPYSEVMV